MTTGTEQPADGVERALGALSAWDAPAPGLWSRALLAEGRHERPGRWARDARGAAVLAAAAVATVAIMVFVLMPSLGKARSSLRSMHEGGDAPVSGRAAAVAGPAADAPIPVDALETDLTVRRARVNDRPDSPAAPARLVAKKANIDLAVPDVRAAFVKAAFLISEAGGEYVEDSSLTGDGERAQANLTLRVRAERLGQVLGALRELGGVVSEGTRGEDVTDQAVDLDARLRNEQRVEAELAELLASRRDAPLKDIMEVRDSLSKIRENIERLTAQRERLSRQVSLATVLVVIRHESAVRVPTGSTAGEGFGAYFSRTLGRAWLSATRGLADALGFLVVVLVGGAVWWVLVLGLAFAAWRVARSRARRGADEPPPAV